MALGAAWGRASEACAGSAGTCRINLRARAKLNGVTYHFLPGMLGSTPAQGCTCAMRIMVVDEGKKRSQRFSFHRFVIHIFTAAIMI